MQNRHNKQQGIVLISSLIFMILILGLLRVTLGTSQLMERKSGIDYDVMRATEHSNNGLREIESTKINQTPTPGQITECQLAGGGTCDTDALAWQLTLDYWSNDSNLDSTKGYYNGASTTNPKPLKAVTLDGDTQYTIERFKHTDLGMDDANPFTLLRVTTTGFGLKPDDKDENVTKVAHEAIYILAGESSAGS